MTSKASDYSYKIAIIGSTGTGKTQLLRLLETAPPHGWAVKRYDNHGRDSVVFEHLPLKTPRVLAVCGLSGASERGSPSVNLGKFRGAQGAILVFSYEEPPTFDALTDWLSSFYSAADGGRVLFLVATHQPPTKDQGIFRRRVQAFCDSARVDEFFEMARPDSAQVGRIFTRMTERLAPRGAATREFLTTHGFTKINQ
jgi:hypothetical protein